MPSTETISEKIVRKTAKQAGKEAAREAFLEMSLGGDETEGMPLEALDGNADESLGEAAAGFDIFQDVGKTLSEKGEVIKYIIKREGERVGSKYHPYTWERLAKDYGPGHYQVIARSESRNRFIKSQTQIIGDVEAYSEPSKNKDADDEGRETVTSRVEWQQPQMSFIEMWNLMQSQSDRARQEAMQQATQQAQTQVAMITAMTEMMKNQQLQGQQLFMEMSKMTAQVAEKMAQTQEKLMEKLNARMDKLSEMATKKPEGPTWGDILKMQNESQNKGFELFDKIMRLAEMKADEKVEMIQMARENSDSDGDKKKSLTDTLIESLLPVIASSLSGQQRQVLADPRMQQVPQVLPQPRRDLRSKAISTRNAQIDGEIQRGPRNSQTNSQKTNAAKDERKKAESKPVVVGSGPSVGPSIVIGQPKIAVPPITTQGPVLTTAKEVEVKVTETVADKVEVLETPTNLGIKTEVKARCNEILPVFLGGLMLEATEVGEAAQKTIEFLNEHGISRELFLNNVEAKDLIDVARQYELPNEAHQWLNDLYAHIQSQPRNDVGRKSPAGTEHEAASRG